MAKLELLPRKEFEITLSGGEKINGKFSYWAEKRFCEKRGLHLGGFPLVFLSLLKVQQAIAQKQSADGGISPEDSILAFKDCQVKDDDIVLPVLCAVEYMCRKNKQPFTYTDIDVCDWLEELGNGAGITLISHFLASEDSGEKKTAGTTAP